MTTLTLREEFEAQNGLLDDAEDQTAYLGKYSVFLEAKFVEIEMEINDRFEAIQKLINTFRS